MEGGGMAAVAEEEGVREKGQLAQEEVHQHHQLSCDHILYQIIFSRDSIEQYRVKLNLNSNL